MDWTWSDAVEIAGGGFGVTILVLVILSVVIWIVGLVMQKTRAGEEDTK